MRPLLLVLLLTGAAWAVSLSQAVLDDAVRDGAYGVQAAVVRDGKVLWQGASGLADRRTKRKVTVDTPFRIASCTKTMIATLVLQLVDAGKLRLDDSAAKVLGERRVPAGVTVRSLLNHTSGLPDYLDEFYEVFEDDPRREWTDRQAVDIALALRPGKPGAYEYSNTNYILLGVMLQKVGGEPVGAQMQKRIFRPLGMTSSTCGSFASAPKDVAHGYGEDDTDYAMINQGDGLADGGVLSTSRDMARFMDGLMRGRLLKPATMAAMKKTVDDGEGAQYGLGLGYFPEQGCYGHDGAIEGYLSQMYYYTESGVAIAAATNRTGGPTDEAFDEITDLLRKAGGY